MIRETRSDILTADVDTLVCPVNTVGVMGAGLAKQFRLAYPAMFDDYAGACRRGEMLLGSVRVYRTGSASPRFIIGFPTKKHWSQPSRVGFISTGLLSLRQTIEQFGVTSVAVPALGCGLGGLNWPEVRSLIYQHLGDLEGVEIVLYAPRVKGAGRLDKKHYPY
jgi:O-acetyl-ADP-ribose deacetylase (regulator of RNase III)